MTTTVAMTTEWLIHSIRPRDVDESIWGKNIQVQDIMALQDMSNTMEI